MTSDELNNEAGGEAAGDALPAVAAQNATDRIERINIEEEMQKA